MMLPISVVQIQLSQEDRDFLKSNHFSSQPKTDGEVLQLSLILTLKSIGFDAVQIRHYLANKDSKSRRMALESQRKKLLAQVHDFYRAIDTLDALLFHLKKEE